MTKHFSLSDLCFPLQLHLSALKCFNVIIYPFFFCSSLKHLLVFQRMHFFASTWLFWNELFLSCITIARAQKGVQIQVAACFECVYGESWGKYEVRSLWNGVEILRCQHIPASPHDIQLGHTAQGPARLPQCCCWLPPHGDLSQAACKGPTFFTITLTAVIFCKTANAYMPCYRSKHTSDYSSKQLREDSATQFLETLSPEESLYKLSLFKSSSLSFYESRE